MSPGGSKQAPGLVHPSLPPIQYQGLGAAPSQGSNWPALLRASEIAREADMNVDDDAVPPSP